MAAVDRPGSTELLENKWVAVVVAVLKTIQMHAWVGSGMCHRKL